MATSLPPPETVFQPPSGCREQFRSSHSAQSPALAGCLSLRAIVMLRSNVSPCLKETQVIRTVDRTPQADPFESQEESKRESILVSHTPEDDGLDILLRRRFEYRGCSTGKVRDYNYLGISFIDVSGKYPLDIRQKPGAVLLECS
jgi:hypothetical protein